MVCCSNSVQQGFNEKPHRTEIGNSEEGGGIKVLPKT